ncbi:uncharacterized protein LOC134840607 [Symsagittifera roscoffensis]|uniref:uncharacterized protein LOC134840607 n=1 Tax=Symsagittifera roscoffensis TaxID=84072 RepID=UPI00307BDC1C
MGKKSTETEPIESEEEKRQREALNAAAEEALNLTYGISLYYETYEESSCSCCTKVIWDFVMKFSLCAAILVLQIVSLLQMTTHSDEIMKRALVNTRAALNDFEILSSATNLITKNLTSVI